MRELRSVSPGEMLKNEFLVPLGLSVSLLAKNVGVPTSHIRKIVAGKRSVTADDDLKLCSYFGLSNGWWLRCQTNYNNVCADNNLELN
jgi:antitoxin HigA-1